MDQRDKPESSCKRVSFYFTLYRTLEYELHHPYREYGKNVCYLIG